MDNIIPSYMVNNILPKQKVIKVRGLTAARGIRMCQDSSIIIADEMDPIIYFCQTDTLGNLTVTPYDISPHKTDEEKQQDKILEALGLINQRLTNLEDRINESDVSATNTSVQRGTNQGSMEYVQNTEQSNGNNKQYDKGKSKGPRT